jgi:flagellar protein FliO/FliZ
MLELGLRVVLSLAVVLGLFWMVARTGSRRLGGRDRGLVRVRTRQSLSRGSSLAVVEVGSRVLVLGVSDSGVRLLTEMTPEQLAIPVGVASDRPGQAVPPPATLEPAPARYPDYADSYSAGFVPDEAYGPDYAAAYAPDAPPLAAGPLHGSLLDRGVWRGAWASATPRTHRHGGAA